MPAASLKFAKPTRETRHSAKIETSDLALPKAHFLRDGEYRAWISKTHRCILPRHDGKACARIGDRLAVEACHLEHGGRGVKGSDASCIPLCPVHHDMLDAETLPWQIVAFLWMRCWQFREEWFRIKGATK
jgi:hypothetical protein